MAQSVYSNRYGPDWPLGMIAVVTPGTPVGIMSLVDPNAYTPTTPSGSPTTATPTSTGASGGPEYSPNVQQLMFQGIKSNAGTGTVNNTGNIYIVRKGAAGSGNRTDFGAMVCVVSPGQTIFLSSAPLNRNQFSPYDYYVDADNAGDSALVTLLVG